MVGLIRFAYPWVLLWLAPAVAAAFIFYHMWKKKAVYEYPLAGLLARTGYSKAPTHVYVFGIIRITIFAILLFLIPKPQIVDQRSSILIDGIDIMLVLDISGSMQFPDYDKRSRLEVAKEEALNFINKRTDDAIGLVIFGNDALSRVPLTLDKKIVNEAIKELEIGLLNPEGTVLATAIITAASRLKKSPAKSKIMILLTDGEPSKNDMDPYAAIKVAQEMGIKIYTIGIGNEEEFFMHPVFGIVPKPKINKALLQKIAHETGAKFFEAHNPKDMREIYNTIDQLEKTTHETSLYQHYYDIFVPFVWIIILLLCMELLLSTTIWFGL